MSSPRDVRYYDILLRPFWNLCFDLWGFTLHYSLKPFMRSRLRLNIRHELDLVHKKLALVLEHIAQRISSPIRLTDRKRLKIWVAPREERLAELLETIWP